MSYTSSQNINEISRQVHFMKFMTHNFVLKAKLLKSKEKVDRYKLKKNQIINYYNEEEKKSWSHKYKRNMKVCL